VLGLADDGTLLLSEADGVIRFHRIEALPARCSAPFRSDDPVVSLSVLIATMEEHYAFFERRDPGWSERAGNAAAALTTDTGEAGLFEVVTGLLSPLGDAQVRVSVPGSPSLPTTVWSAGPAPPGTALLAERIREGTVPGLTSARVALEGGVVSGRLPGDFGYLAITRLAGFGDEPAGEERALAGAVSEALADLGGVAGLVVDLRVNRGGREALAMLAASRFVIAETVVATRQVRVGGTDQYADAGEIVVKPMPTGPFPAPLAVLVGPATAGAAEVLALALSGVPGVILVGAPTAGSPSPMLLRELPNGWTMGLPHQRLLAASGEFGEGRGVPVEVRVKLEASPESDPVIEAALEVLGRG
jgi:hypothetical protein